MNILVVGCGSIGKRHIRNLQTLQAGEIVAFDLRADRRAEVEAAYQIKTYVDYADALAQHPNIVLICTPTSLHMPYAQQASAIGAHVFIEKPLSHTLEGVDAFLQTVATQKTVTLVGCNYRFHPGLQMVKNLLNEGQIGTPLSAHVEFGQYLPDWHPYEDYRQGYSANQKLGGGIILDRIHELDYITWLLGYPTEIFCFAHTTNTLEIDTEDIAKMLLRFDKGLIADIHVDYLQRAYHSSCKIVGQTGTIVWNYRDHAVHHYTAHNKKWQITRWQDTYDANDMYIKEMTHFLNCIHKKQRPELDAKGGKNILLIAEAAKQSARTGHKVPLNFN